MTAASPALGSARASQPNRIAARAPATRWHVSPAVDLLGYAFSWLPLALPFWWVVGASVGSIDASRNLAAPFIVIGVVLIDVHRHFTFPYVYLNRALRQAFPVRFWLLPVLSLALLTQLPYLASSSKKLYAAETGAIVAWVVLIAQLARVDRIGGASLRRAVGAVLTAAIVAGVCVAVAPRAGGWAWLLGAAGASLAVARLSTGPQVPRLETWLPLGAMAALLAGAAATSPIVTVGMLVSSLSFIYVLWLIYHTVMQKYGILRIYSAKSGVEAKVPRWVDRALVWCWFPMVIVWAVTESPWAIVGHLDRVAPGVSSLVYPVIDLFTAHATSWFAIASAAIAGGFGAFLYYEWSLHRLRNAPRLAFAAGTALLYASVFWIGVVGLYTAFAVTHCIEYMTFLWAFQRQRFPGQSSEAPLLSRMLQWPVLYYGGVALFVGAVFFVARYSSFYFGIAPDSLALFGVPLYSWAFWYSIVQAFLHFYYDGFLWKMRPELTRAL